MVRAKARRESSPGTESHGVFKTAGPREEAESTGVLAAAYRVLTVHQALGGAPAQQPSELDTVSVHTHRRGCRG